MVKTHVSIFTLVISSLFFVSTQSLFQESEKIAKFRVYLQDVLSGPNATVYEVARANITSTSPTLFGQVRVVDDLITAGPDPNSEKLGRAQGVITSSDMEHSAIIMNINFMFTGGEYKGSTISMVGRKSLEYDNQELPIVGGTGFFRAARGFSISSNYSYDAATEYGVLVYDFYVVYMEQVLGFSSLFASEWLIETSLLIGMGMFTLHMTDIYYTDVCSDNLEWNF